MEKASVSLSIPFLRAAWLWEGGCSGSQVFSSMTEVLEQGIYKRDAAFRVECHLATMHLRKDLPIHIDLGMLRPTCAIERPYHRASHSFIWPNGVHSFEAVNLC